jgi:hypothetical protein
MAERHKFWIIFLLWSLIIFAALVLTRWVMPFAKVSEGISYYEQALYALILSPYPAFLYYWIGKKCENALAFRRLLMAGATKILIIFGLQILAFILFEITSEIELPVGSMLYDTDMARQISTYSRIPLLSQFIAVVLFLAAQISKSAAPGDKRAPVLVKGLLFYIPYLVGFVLCHMLWKSYLLGLLLPPNKVNLFLLFVHWLPTVYFLALTYTYSVIPKKQL